MLFLSSGVSLRRKNYFLCVQLIAAIVCQTSINADVEIIRIGSEIFQSSSSLDFPGVMFLSDDAISRSGVLFAFSAYIIRNTTFSIQLWRPSTTGTTSGDNALKAFQLIAEIPFNSTNLFARNDVYFNRMSRKQSCYKTIPGDRIGVAFATDRWPVPYIFNPSTQQVYTLTFNASNPPKVNDVVKIDQLIFPYKFSCAAWIVIDESIVNDSTSEAVCPDNITIPSYTTTSAPTTETARRTGAPGATGATGPMGEPGSPGMPGAPGPTGFTGQQGPMGPPGMIGVAGDVGYTGVVGPPGPMGDTGASGASGLPGAKGATGATGLMGPQGPPGPSANVSDITDPSQPSASQQGTSASVPWHRRQSMIIGVYIWLAIISFLSLIIFIWTLVLCSVYCRLKTYRKASGRDYSSYLNAYATK